MIFELLTNEVGKHFEYSTAGVPENVPVIFYN
jgi:hypothetical protein